MPQPSKLRFGAPHGRKWALQRLGELLGRPDIARPTQICAPLTSRCNFGCGFCPHPAAERHHELSLEQWTRLLADLQDWLGTFRINFLGGEPFLHPDFFAILEQCHDRGIVTGVTTNGSALTERNARRIAELGVFNVSISLDSLDPSRHDTNRGFRGAHARIMRGVDYLNRYRSDATRLCFRTTVMEWNVHELVDIADLARDLGVISAFQPVEYRDMDERHLDPDDYVVPDHAPGPMARFKALSVGEVPDNLAGNWVESLDVLAAQVDALVDRKARGCAYPQFRRPPARDATSLRPARLHLLDPARLQGRLGRSHHPAQRVGAGLQRAAHLWQRPPRPHPRHLDLRGGRPPSPELCGLHPDLNEHVSLEARHLREGRDVPAVLLR